MKKIVIFSFCFTFLNAEHYFVTKNGNDNNSGLSREESFLTIQHAADIVQKGDTVSVYNGEYNGFYVEEEAEELKPVYFIAEEDNVRITARNTMTPDGINIENSSYIFVEGFKIIGIERAGIRIAQSNNITLNGNFCSHNGRWGIFTGFADNVSIEYNECEFSQEEHGIYVSNSADNPHIRFNLSHDNYQCGIHMNGDESMGGDGLITNAIVESNIVYENGIGGGSGINCDGVANSYIYNNLIVDNHTSGISLYRIDASNGSFNTKIYNNTIVNAEDGRWCININTSSTNDTVLNNILINLNPSRGSISIDNSSLNGFYSDYNLVVDRFSNDWGETTVSLSEWQSSGFDTHSQIADDRKDIFVDYTNNNYHLKSSSQAIDKGTNYVDYIVKYDIEDVKRDKIYDIGAYEYVKSGIDEYKKKIAVNRIYLNNLKPGDRINIYNVNGIKIYSSVARKSYVELNSGSLCPGIYFISINSNQRKHLLLIK